MSTPRDQEEDPPEKRAAARFASEFGRRPEIVVRAPGRVELLGNHTDYNGGLVLAAAIDRYTAVAGSAVDGDRARLLSLQAAEPAEFAVGSIAEAKAPVGSWARYAQAVAWALGPLSGGFDAVLSGNVPLGTGLSSSASLEAAIGLFLRAADLVPGGVPSDDHDRMELARLLQKAENQFVGVASGLLDQFSSLFGRTGHALMLDCQTLNFDRVPIGGQAPAIILCDSRTSRKLADGLYNRRRSECEQVVAWFQGRKPGVAQLRDLTADNLQDAWDQLDPVARRRARHVVTENDRVQRGAEALRAGDLRAFGRLMSESHASSRDDFENSSPALDRLIEAAQDAPGFLGGKLSGAGWAGCTVNLVEANQADAFAETIEHAFDRWQLESPELPAPTIHVCTASAGALVISG